MAHCAAPLVTINSRSSGNRAGPCKTANPAGWPSSKHFSLQVDPRGVTSDGYRVNLQLFQDRQLLLETNATLSKSSPLVIKGPQIGAGQLLLLLVVQ